MPVLPLVWFPSSREGKAIGILAVANGHAGRVSVAEALVNRRRANGQVWQIATS